MLFNFARCRRSKLVAVASFVAFLVIPGCGSQGDVSFNNTIAELQAKLAAAEKKVEDTMEWPPNDKANEGAASDGFRTTVTDARKQFDELAVPQTKAAKNFYDGFNDYLKVQEEAVPLYKKYLDPDRKLTDQEMAGVREGIGTMKAKRNGLVQRLLALQQAFVQESGIRLKPKTYP